MPWKSRYAGRPSRQAARQACRSTRIKEGNDDAVRKAFRLLTLKTGGTYSAFNPAVPQTIERLAAQLDEVARAAVASVLAIETNRT
jgi:hypothetical protein